MVRRLASFPSCCLCEGFWLVLHLLSTPCFLCNTVVPGTIPAPVQQPVTIVADLPNNILFLTNLPLETTEMMLSMLFNQYHHHTHAVVIDSLYCVLLCALKDICQFLFSLLLQLTASENAIKLALPIARKYHETSLANARNVSSQLLSRR